MPIQVQLLGNVGDGGAAAAPPHIQRKALRVQRIVDQKLQSLPLHRAAPAAVDPTHFEIEVNPVVGTGKIADPAYWPAGGA